MHKPLCSRMRLFPIISLLLIILLGCSNQTPQTLKQGYNPLKKYVSEKDPTYKFDLHKVIKGEDYETHILRMVSGQWLTTNEVKYPEWWHWVHIVVPDTVTSNIALLYIGGGERSSDEPEDANEIIRAAATNTKSIAIYLHNVPNQPTEFVGDTEGPRWEDALIAYGWRKFMEEGGTAESVEWLARLPMTRAAVRAMDSAANYAKSALNYNVDQFVVAGGSKRGWTTWTTAIADDRVIAIAPIVIDVLNTVQSFKHHWKAYGAWAEAVDDYVNEGIMEWFNSKEFEKLLSFVEPYSYRNSLTMPKMLINASGDQFFLPDSWQFYWDNLVGEKNVRYVPNAGHGLDETDAPETLISYYHSIVKNTPRPKVDWHVQNGEILIKTDPASPPNKVKLWQATNEKIRDFRVDVAGEIWTSETIAVSQDGTYKLSVNAPPNGWTAFFGELSYPGPGDFPFKITTGVVVVPEHLPFDEFKPSDPRGTQQ
jgi:PhoPQ-activated pathogenicity-related protein